MCEQSHQAPIAPPAPGFDFVFREDRSPLVMELLNRLSPHANGTRSEAIVR